MMCTITADYSDLLFLKSTPRQLRSRLCQALSGHKQGPPYKMLGKLW